MVLTVVSKDNTIVITGHSLISTIYREFLCVPAMPPHLPPKGGPIIIQNASQSSFIAERMNRISLCRPDAFEAHREQCYEQGADAS